MRALKEPAVSAPLTEDELVAVFAAALGEPPRTLRVGIGDDAAVWKASPHHLTLLTTDMLVDGVHFRLSQTTPEALGHKALAENLSDIAAMAGWPTVAVVGLGITSEVDVDWARRFYAGMAKLAHAARCAIAGGDIARAPSVTIAISVAGEVRPTQVRTRAGARAGDVAVVTGPLGLAAAGLKLIDATAAVTLDAGFARVLQEAYLTPQPRLREGRFLGSRRAVHALMDISDGISTDAARMAVASGLDLVLDAAALTPGPAVAALAAASGLDPLQYVLHGGDDYELLAAVEARAHAHVARTFAKRLGRPLLTIGRFEKGTGAVWLERAGKLERLAARGYDHLRRIREIRADP